MPSCSTAKNPSGIEILFQEENHEYSSTIDGQKMVYTSGTSLIGKYFEPFDADKIAPFSARKLGLTVEEVKEKWRKAGEDAARFGTRCHEVCEDTILGRSLRNSPENEKEELTFKNAERVAEAIKNRFEVVGVEKIVFDHKLKIAGTIDLLCRSKEQLNMYYIFDWKTNKEITSENKYQKFAFDPISHIADTTLNHYQLQLNLYEYLLKFGRYVPKDSLFKKVLFHLKPDGVDKMVLGDFQSEVKDLIIDYLTNYHSGPSKSGSENPS